MRIGYGDMVYGFDGYGGREFRLTMGKIWLDKNYSLVKGLKSLQQTE